MDKIDIFYFINLDKRTDRLEEISKELKKMEIPPEKVNRVRAFEHKFRPLTVEFRKLAIINYLLIFLNVRLIL